MLPRLVHLDPWLLDFLQIASEKSGVPVNEIIRLGCYAYIIEFAKASGYIPTIDAKSAFLMMKKKPTEDVIKKVADLFQHEARNAASFRIAKGALVTRLPKNNPQSRRIKKPAAKHKIMVI